MVEVYPINRGTKSKAVEDINKISRGVNTIIANEEQKVPMLNLNSTEEEIETVQKYLEHVAESFSEQVEQEKHKDVVNESNVANTVKTTDVKERDSFVSVGDVFRNTKTGNMLRVVSRDARNTVIQRESGADVETKIFANSQADALATNKEYERIEISKAIAPETAQNYSVLVSNLKRKAEELGLLDNNFFTDLQDVDLFNPTIENIKLINGQFHEVFNGNDDTLVKSWLGGIDKILTDALTRQNGSSTINTETNAGEVAIYAGQGSEAEGLGNARHLRYRGNRVGNQDEKLSSYFRRAVEKNNREFIDKSQGQYVEYIVNSGQSVAKFIEIHENNYTPLMHDIAEKNAAIGLKTVFAVGDLEFTHSNGIVQQIAAGVVDDTVFINANVDAELEDVINHEHIHYAIRQLANKLQTTKSNVISGVVTTLRSLMTAEEYAEKLRLITASVHRNYKKPTEFKIADEFCAEIGYLIRYPESADWFTDYDAAVKLFDDLLTLDPQKQTWLNKGIGTSNEESSDAFSNEEKQALSVGDTFLDKKTGGVLRVISRNDANTVIERNAGGKIETKIFANSQADALATNKEYERIEISKAIAPETAQNYSVLVLKLKRKAEGLGLLDNDFYTTLQDVDLFNPTIENIKLINSQFHEVFNESDDELVKSWLGGIDKILTDALTRQNGSSTINTETNAGEVAIYAGQGNEAEGLGLWGYDRHNGNRRSGERLSIYFRRTPSTTYGERFGEDERRIYEENEGKQVELIVNNFQSIAKFTEIPEVLYSDEMRSIVEENMKYGLKTIFTIGDIYFSHSNDTTQSVAATVVDDIIFIDANVDATLKDVSNHEIVHYAIRKLAETTDLTKKDIAKKLVERIRLLAKKEEFDRVFIESSKLVKKSYKNATEFNILDEFCAEIGYLIRYPESAEWFADYDAAVKLFDDLLTLDPKKQTWLNKGIGTSNEESSDAFSNADKQTLSVGDTFLDKKTGGVLRVVSRNDANTVIERNTGGKIETKIFTNSQADMIIANKQFEQIEKPMNTSSQEDVSSTAPSISEDAESSIMAENVDEAHEDITNLTETVEKSLRPEMLSDERIMNMLKSRFGDKPFEALAKDIMLTFERDGSIGEHEILFADGGQAVYDMLERGEADGAENFQMELNNQSENDIIEENNIDSINYSLESKKRNRRRNTLRKRTIYNEYQTNALMWARNTDRKAGDTTILNANGKYFALIEATEDDFIELCKGSYKEVRAEYERVHSEKDTSFHEDINEIRAERDGNLWDLQHVEYGRNDDRDGGQIGSEGLQDDSARSDEHLRGGDKGKYDSGIIEGNEKSDRGLSEEETTISYLLESEEDYGKRRNLLSDGSGKRKNGKSSQKQAQRVDGRTRRYKKGRKTANERRNYCKTQRASGHIRERIVYGHKCEVISEEAYNDDMHKMAERNSQNGIDETIFISGMAELPFTKDGIGNSKKAKGIFIKTKDGRKIVVVQYDNFYFTPEQINDHELIHNDYGSELTQKAKNIILNTLSQKEKEEILGFIAEDYLGIINGDEAEVIEELVANILTGTHYKSDVFNELINAYWKKDDAFISRWEYETSKRSFKREVEKGYYDNLNKMDGWLTPEREYAMLSKAIMAKNAGLTDEQLNPIDFVYAADGFYVYKNISMGNFTVVSKIDIEIEKDEMDFVKEAVNNGAYRDGQGFNKWSGDVWSRRKGDNRYSKWTENTKYERTNDRLSIEQQRSDTVGYPSSARGNNEVESKHSFKRQVEKENYGNLNKTDGRLTPEQEYAMISKAIMAKNAGLTDEQLNPVDFVYAADGFYVYKNISLG